MAHAHAFKFIDLCSGIGGFHIACVANGGVCIQACDIDKGARTIYALNYGVTPEMDVKTLTLPDSIPDLVCFGNPCQPFSTMGLRKGLYDDRGGKVFNAICKHLQNTHAKAFIMENVKGLAMHGDFKKMLKKLEKCGYTLSKGLLNSQNFGTPQHRERVFVVGVRKEIPFSFEKLLAKRCDHIALETILDKAKPDERLHIDRYSSKFDLKNTPTFTTKNGFVIRAEIAPFTDKRLFSSKGAIGTILSSQPPVIYDERYKQERFMSRQELLRCQGFPSRLKWPSHMQSQRKVTKYIGNAVHVGTVKAIIKEMKKQGCL